VPYWGSTNPELTRWPAQPAGCLHWDVLPRIQGDGNLLHAVYDRITWRREFSQAQRLLQAYSYKPTTNSANLHVAGVKWLPGGA
jgi:hypothetical protein